MTRQPSAVLCVHELKTWPRFFNEIIQGRKHTEFRRHDRAFTVGEMLRLREPEVLEWIDQIKELQRLGSRAAALWWLYDSQLGR